MELFPREFPELGNPVFTESGKLLSIKSIKVNIHTTPLSSRLDTQVSQSLRHIFQEVHKAMHFSHY